MAENKDKSELSRRKALARLGLATAAVYAAPTIPHIDGEALATRKSRPSTFPGGKNGGGKNGGGGKDSSDGKDGKG